MTQLVTIKERLYALLPAIYRMRDYAQGEPLRALLGVLEEELVRVEADIARLYDNWFIETCDEWAVPYIGDLVGARLVHAVSQRAFTANTLAYRRRKGTVQTLGALGRDVTGWPARAVEYRPLVITSQHINTPLMDNPQVPNLRRADDLEQSGTPFDQLAHTVDVRTRGRYQQNQVGLFVWRIGVTLVEKIRPAEIQPGCFHINSLGCTTALWSPARSRPGLEGVSDLHIAPQPLRRRTLYRVLEARRQALADGRTAQDPYFDRDPVFSLFVPDEKGKPKLVPPEELVITDLTNWFAPPKELTYKRRGDGQDITLPISAALDPETGRISFPDGISPAKVWVSYHYGSAGELGAGGYDRVETAKPAQARCLSLRDGDTKGVLQQLSDPTAANTQWRTDDSYLLIEIADSDNYSLGAVQVPAGVTLEIRSVNGESPLLSPLDPRWNIKLGSGSALILNGLLIAGGISLSGVAISSPPTLEIRHTTLVPGLRLLPNGSPVEPQSASVLNDMSLTMVNVHIVKSITGPINLIYCQNSSLAVEDSIIDGLGQMTFIANQASLQRATLLGMSRADYLTNTIDTLFCDGLISLGNYDNTVQYCYIPPNSFVNMGFHCQPDLAFSTADPSQHQRIFFELRPWFVSRRFGNPGYAMLDSRCPIEISMGASVEGEMGAFQNLQQVQRANNLIASQDEYLRFGLTLNLFLAT